MGRPLITGTRLAIELAELLEDELLDDEVLDDELLVEELLDEELLTELLDDPVTGALLADEDELSSADAPPQPLNASDNAHAQHQANTLI
jgi:hypothetical protein